MQQLLVIHYYNVRLLKSVDCLGTIVANKSLTWKVKVEEWEKRA